MRLSTEKIKAAILDPDSALRTLAVCYFAYSHSPDPGLMPLVIQAFERFGNDAFDMASFLGDLVQTDESIAWICRKLDQLDPDPLSDWSELFDDLVDALVRADAALLERNAATIREVRHLDERAKADISNRIQIASLAPQELWQRLVEFCHEQDQLADADPDPSDYEYSQTLIDALARYPEQFAEEALKILEREDSQDSLEVMAVRLAGAMKLEAATEALIDMLADFDSWAADSARWALPRIGTDSVVRKLAARYVEDEGLRPEIASLLQHFYSDTCVQICLELLELEPDDEERQSLIEALLSNFATEAIEPARQFILAHEKTPSLVEFRDVLLLTCRILDARFPEFDAWQEDSTHDVEFLRAWYEEHGSDDFDDEGAWDADDFFDEEFDEPALDDTGDSGFDVEPPDTVVRHEARVGRNDPCPCGSGKKYKKCCLHKQALG
ncbi:MAG TPA: SEC-C metal-binding domain-containing protein [Pirellulales bacterium]|jgi:hypothetical protein|nr:SEC-C metal-binding domain-containing protein [Pirellulales bacterium]